MLYALPRSLKGSAGPAPAARAHPCAPRHSHIPVHRGRGTFLSPQESTPKKGFLSLAGRNSPGSLCSSPHRGSATRNATVDGVTQTVLAHIPRWGCGARRALRGFESTPVPLAPSFLLQLEPPPYRKNYQCNKNRREEPLN